MTPDDDHADAHGRTRSPNPRGAKTAEQQGSEGTFDQGGRSKVAPEPVRGKEPRRTPEAVRERDE